MKARYKRFRNFSKLLYKINLGQTHYIRNSKTFDKNSSFRRDNSSSNLIKPEIEYVTKLDFFIPKSPTLENKKTLNSTVENKIFENKLENQRKELENKISKIKQNLKPLNDELTKIISEIDNLKLDFEILQNNKTCSIIEKNLKKTILINSIFSPKRERDSLPFLLNKNNTLDEKNKIESILSKHKKDMKSKKNLALMKFAQLKEKRKELIKKIKTNENELKTLREEKNKIRNELLSHYHNILHEGNDIRKDGLSWVIQAIWNLKSEVLPSYLPKFLDEESIEFLLNFSNKKIKLKDMYKTLQIISQKINENKNSLNINFINNDNNNNQIATIDQESISKESDTCNFYNNYELEDVKENSDKWLVNTVMNKISKKLSFNDFFTTRNNLLISKKESFDNNKENDINIKNVKNNSSLNKLLFNKTYKEVYELSNTKKLIEKKIYKLKNELKNMTEKELERLNNCFYKEGYQTKYNIDKYKIISAVIGEENARDDFNKQIKESQNYLSILNNLRK